MLVITARFLEPVYEATADGAAEWPPHPARLICALVAAAGDDAEARSAIRALESASPTICVPEGESATLRAYVPTNAIGKTESNRPARTSNERSWSRVALRQPVVQFAWEVDLDADTLAVLGHLCRRVPYLGRAASPVLLDLDTPVDKGLTKLVPGTGNHRVRVGYDGYVEALVAAFESGQAAHSVSRFSFYRQPGTEADSAADPTPVASSYPDMLVRAFAPGVRLDGRMALGVTKAWKKAVLRRLGVHHTAEELSLLNGHHDHTRRQCAFLALPFVGYPHATGDLLGVAVAVSPDLPAPVRRSLLGLFGLVPGVAPLGVLSSPGLGDIELAEPDGRRTIDPDRWVGPASTWVSVLPVLPDRYPDDEAEAEEFVADGCVMAGYPRPRVVELLVAPAVVGAPHLRRSDTIRRPSSPARPRLQVRLRFDCDVTGPVVLGHLRHLGLGLCIPEVLGTGGGPR